MNRTRTLLLAGLMILTTVIVTPVAAQDEDDAVGGAVEVATAFLALDYPTTGGAGVAVTDAYTSDHNGVSHVYLRQTVDGIEVHGAEATVNVRDEAIVFAGDRFLADVAANASGEQAIDADDAVGIAAADTDSADGSLVEDPELVYRALEDDTARLAWRVQIETMHHWWVVFVDAETGAVLYVDDYVDSEEAAHIAASTARPEDAAGVAQVLDATAAVDLQAAGDANRPIVTPNAVDDGSAYNVYPLPLEGPLDGNRRIVDNPADANASPFGWHDTDGVAGPEFTITRGNNVNAYADSAPDNSADPASQPNGGSGLEFDNPLISYDATPASYRDAAVTNLFYWNNLMHDITFQYGFDEKAGNFQQTNYSGDGIGNDPVLAEAQDGSFVLNANFSTPEDGRSGRMQMFLWVDAFRDLGGDVARVHSTQVRDGDVDAGVIAHEYGHGISNRLVGGPSNVSCLSTYGEREGEGWSDWWSYALTMRDGDDGTTPRGVGNYVIYYDEFGRQGPGIRITPYSTDMTINPSTYNTIKTAAAPHGVGYVWATMLWDVYWNLVDDHGFNPNPYEGWETGGNNLAMQLVVDGMKMAPCSPGFIDARDAILAADAALTGDGTEGSGENLCAIWDAFARRGLGTDADGGDPASKTDGTDGFGYPSVCSDYDRL